MRSEIRIRNQAQPATVELAHITNRFEPTSPDGWIMLAPYGDHPHAEGLQRLDQAAARSMVERWQARGAPELPIDFDHRTYTRSDDTESAGWVQELAARDDGLWGRVRWSDSGESALRGGRYRQLSPTWTVRTQTSEDNGATRILQPVELMDVALTNQPNLKGLPMLSNTRGSAPKQIQNEKPMTELLNALGLKPEATEQEALAAVADLKAKSDTLQNRCNELDASLQTLRNAQVEADLAAYAHLIPDADVDSARQLIAHNREAAIRIFEAAGKRLAGEAPLSNRNAPQQPAAPLTNQAQRQAELVERIRLSNGCSFTDAWDQARREQPALFTNTDTQEEK